jgi:hypothetical protein
MKMVYELNWIWGGGGDIWSDISLLLLKRIFCHHLQDNTVQHYIAEHDFQDAFKKWQKRWEWSICMEGGCFEDDGSK